PEPSTGSLSMLPKPALHLPVQQRLQCPRQIRRCPLDQLLERIGIERVRDWRERPQQALKTAQPERCALWYLLISLPGNVLLYENRVLSELFPRCRPSQDLFHRLTFSKLIDKLIEIADFPHDRILDIFDAYAADHSGNKIAKRIECRGI